MNELMKTISLTGIIIILTVIVFYPSLNNGFTNWDDHFYIQANKDIHNLSWENIKNIFTSAYVLNYHPLTTLSYALEYHFFNVNPFIYHFTNLLFHLFNTLLVFWFIFILTENKSSSFLASILFGIHPLHVESVVWISERKDVLSTFFFLLSLISYIYYQKHEKINYLDKTHIHNFHLKLYFKSLKIKFPVYLTYYYLSIIAMIFSLLSKAMGITLPFIILLCDYYMNKKQVKLRDKIPFFILAFVFGIIGLITQKSANKAMTYMSYTLFDNIFVACYGLIFYIVKLFHPVNLSALYPYPEKINNTLPLSLLISPVIVIVLIIAVLWSVTYTKKILFGSAFYLITICPVLKLIPIGGAIVADRYMYIPSIGLFYIIGECFNWIYNKNIKYNNGKNVSLIIIVCGAIISLSLLTMERCMIWENSITLWDDVINKYPVAEAYYNRAIEYELKGNYETSIEDYTKAVKIYGLFAQAYNNRGNIYYKLKKYDLAMEDYDMVLKINPDLAKTYRNRGMIYVIKGQYDKAIKDFSEALKLEPDYIEAYQNRGTAYGTIKEYNKAIKDFTEILYRDPHNKEALFNRSLTYFYTGDYDRAWNDIHNMKILNYDINPVFLEDLKAKSGKNKFSE